MNSTLYTLILILKSHFSLFVNLFNTHLFNKYLLSIYHVPGTVPEAVTHVISPDPVTILRSSYSHP